MAKLLEYQQLLQDEAIEIQDLPKEIRLKINVLKPTIIKFNEKPSEKLRNSIDKMDIEVCELIQDFIDGNSEEEEEDSEAKAAEQALAAEAEAKAKLEAEQKEKADFEAAEAKKAEDAANEEAENKRKKEQELADAEAARIAEEEATEAKRIADEKELADKQKYSFGTHEMEIAILVECNKNDGHIEEKKFAEIIKRSPKYPVQEVFSIKLRRQYARSVYILES